MAYTPQVLTIVSDYEEIRALSGVFAGFDSDQFPDERILTEIFLGQAENLIIKKLNAMSVKTTGACPNFTQINATPPTGPATPADKTFFRNAIKFYVAYLYCLGENKAVSTSITDGAQTIDNGGLAALWIQQSAANLAESDHSLKLITGWQEYIKMPAII